MVHAADHRKWLEPRRPRSPDRYVWTGGCCKGKPSQRGTLGLAPMYSAYLRSVCKAPDHHGYERAFDLISGQTSKGYSDPQYSIAPVRPVLHCVGLHSRRPRRERVSGGHEAASMIFPCSVGDGLSPPRPCTFQAPCRSLVKAGPAQGRPQGLGLDEARRGARLRHAGAHRHG